MYLTGHGRPAFIPSGILLFMRSRVFYTWVSCVSKRYWISVRYVGVTDSSVTRVSVFRHVRNIARSVCRFRHGCQSVRTSAWNTQLPLGGFHWSLKFEHFSKIYRENPSFIKTDKDYRYFISRRIGIFRSHLAGVFFEWEIFQTKVVEKFETHFLCSIASPPHRTVYEIMWKNIVEPDRPQMTIWCTRIAFWIPEATDTLRTCNTYCFSTASMVARTPLIVTL